MSIYHAAWIYDECCERIAVVDDIGQMWLVTIFIIVLY